MAGVMGGAGPKLPAPLRPRDARGRFVRIPLPPYPETAEEILRVFARTKKVQFADPFHEGTYTLVKHRSMKGFPVSLYHSRYQSGSWHSCRGYYSNYGQEANWGRQLAISPTAWYGWPGDKWNGEWTAAGMASLLVHLALSVDLSRMNCGEKINSGTMPVSRIRRARR